GSQRAPEKSLRCLVGRCYWTLVPYESAECSITALYLFAPFHPDSKLDRGLRVEPTAPRRGPSLVLFTPYRPRPVLPLVPVLKALNTCGGTGPILESSVAGAEARYLLGVRKRAKRPRTRSRSLLTHPRPKSAPWFRSQMLWQFEFEFT